MARKLFHPISQRLLSLLQLTRMALVFTAVADSQCTMLLAAQQTADSAHLPLEKVLSPSQILALIAVSIGMYGFGMSLNDIIDRRRDRQLAAHRPLPSGRVGIGTAHVLCASLGLMAVLAAGFYDMSKTDLHSQSIFRHGSLLLTLGTLMLITFYDMAGKYLVWPGLLSLGLIRLFHCLIPAPWVPVVWHPLLLLNHVTILSAVAYHWEEKRPALRARNWWAIFGGLALIDILAVVATGERHRQFWAENLHLTWGLLLPLGAALTYVAIGWTIRRRSATPRQAGAVVMLYGLLWLIVYDACFVDIYVGWFAASLLVLLLPTAYLSVQLMVRWWSQIIAVSQRPEFKRVRT